METQAAFFMTKKPLSQEIIDRASGAWRALTGQQSAAWMGPQDPPATVVPLSQEESTRARMWDYPVGVNLRYREERDSFAQLRALADNCTILRSVIETRKDQLCALKFSVGPIDAKKNPDQRCIDLEVFLRFPDSEHTWAKWLRMLLEDMFVIDAATIYVDKIGKNVQALELIDGATIKRVIDARGRTPKAPETAYQQILKGVTAGNYTRDELMYEPRNIRTNKMYGYSPVEQVVMMVNIAIRKELHQLQYYTEGSLPDLLITAPEDWQMEQIAQFNNWWTDKYAGNTAARRAGAFVPNGVKTIDLKENALKDEFDEWLARVICYVFNVSPHAFVKAMNRATAQTSQETATEEGFKPIMAWVKNVMDGIIWKHFGHTDLEFKWIEKGSVNPKDQALIDDLAVKNGTRMINQIRADRGEDPVDGGDIPMVLTGSGYVPINQAFLSGQELEVMPVAQEQAPSENKTQQKKQSESVGADGSRNATEVDKITKAKKAIKPIDKDAPAVVKVQRKLAQALGGFFKRKSTEIANAALKLNKADALDQGFEDWSVELADLFGPYLAQIVKTGAGQATQQLALDSQGMFDVVNERALEWAKDKSAELVGMKWVNGELVPNPRAEYSIVNSTREMIRGEVAQAVEEGWSTDKLAGALEESHAFSPVRAEMIARTETATAQTQGALLVYRESGVVSQKKWITGAGCCDECQDLDGEIVGLDEEFDGGVDAPPLHPACRCDIVPVVGNDDEE